MARKTVVVAGRLKFVSIVADRAKSDNKRKKRENPTPEHVKENNERLAVRHLSILLCHNYEDGDYHIILTYKKEPEPEEAERLLRNFLDRLRRLYKKHGLECKWTAVTEYKNKRLHHHMILNRLDRELIAKTWKHGIVFFRELYGNGDYRKLAEYLIKETSKTFREDGISKCRYRHAKCVRYPDEKTDLSAKDGDLFREPKATSGYYLDRDSIQKGRNPYTGAPYLHYVEIALDDPPKYKIWPRGRRRKYQKFYYPVPPEDEQLSFHWDIQED